MNPLLQFHVAFSSSLSGVGIWAGPTDFCYARYYTECMYFPSFVNEDLLVRDANTLSGSAIDDVSNMAYDRYTVVPQLINVQPVLFWNI